VYEALSYYTVGSRGAACDGSAWEAVERQGGDGCGRCAFLVQKHSLYSYKRTFFTSTKVLDFFFLHSLYQYKSTFFTSTKVLDSLGGCVDRLERDGCGRLTLSLLAFLAFLVQKYKY